LISLIQANQLGSNTDLPLNLWALGFALIIYATF